MKRFLISMAVALPALISALFPAPARADSQFTSINGGEIAFSTCSEEKTRTVVLLHDGLANASVWDGVWPALCKQYRVVRYDRRGYGASPPATSSYAPADDLAAMIKLVGAARVSLIAASAGGGIATEFALASPESVDKLVLVGPAIAGYPLAPAFLGRLKPFIDAQQKGDRAAAIAAITANPHMVSANNQAARDRLAAIMRKDRFDTGVGFQRVAPDTMKRVGELRVPTLVIVGAGDDPQNIGQAEALKVMVPEARLETIPNAGHLPYLEQPDTFVRLVTGFLK
jgi:pimeloyl-ACP methyl ester carboxylesterase